MAAILAILLGAYGAHKFYIGDIKKGIIYCLVTVLGSFIVVGPLVMVIISIVEGVKYLKNTSTDEEFNEMYVKTIKK